MIYKIVIGLLLLATAIYYIFCFLEIFGVVKFTDKNTTVKIPQMFIPFYYIFHNDKPAEEPVEPQDYPLSIFPKYPLTAISRVAQVSLSITDQSNHGWTVELPSWMTLEVNSGVGSKSVLITIKRNTGKNPRSGDIIITDITNGDVFTIPVTQNAKSAENPQVILTIASGQYKTNTENNYDLIWDIRKGNDDAGEQLFSGQLGYPCQSGSRYNWGENQWNELVPESEWGTKKTIHYELAVVDYEDNGHAFQVLTGTAQVDIPAEPDGAVNLSIDLPNFGI